MLDHFPFRTPAQAQAYERAKSVMGLDYDYTLPNGDVAMVKRDTGPDHMIRLAEYVVSTEGDTYEIPVLGQPDKQH
jgi:hypothetical protein